MEKDAPLCLIVDGGGTSTRCQVFSCLDGSLVGSSTAGESNATVLGLDVCVRTILAAVSHAGHFARPFAVVWCGIAGADDQATCTRLHDLFLSFAPDLVAKPDDLMVTNDCDLLAAAIPLHGCKAGITLIAGTGSNAMAFRPSTDPTRLLPVEACGRVGGWGHILGDEGSAYWMGREALRKALAYRFDSTPAALLEEDSRSRRFNYPSDTFVRELLEHLDCRSVDDLLATVLLGTDDQIKARIASIAPLVTKAAGAQSFADRIVRDAATFHAAAACSLARQTLFSVSMKPIDRLLVLGGALFHRCTDFAELTGAMLEEKGDYNIGFCDHIVVDDAAKVAGEALTKHWRDRQARTQSIHA